MGISNDAFYFFAKFYGFTWFFYEFFEFFLWILHFYEKLYHKNVSNCEGQLFYKISNQNESRKQF